jgi:Uma2 family endonuclease
VLSPSTQEYDCGEKLSHYQQIESLRESLLIAQDERRIELWARRDDGVWSSSERRAGRVELGSIDAKLVPDDVYRDPLGP